MQDLTTTSAWAPAGLKQLMVEGGFADDDVQVFGWGNKHAPRHISAARCAATDCGETSTNDEEYPLMVWAFAKKTP
jgi:hypothetical protein